MKNLFYVLLLLPIFSNAELITLEDEELQKVEGKSGITINARIDLGAGSRISYTSDYANIDYNTAAVDKSYWLVFHELTGGIEFEGLKFDLVDTFGPTQSDEAIVWTMPERIEFNQLDIEGLYLADTNVVAGGNDRYIMGLSLDGSLYLPAQTKAYVFPTN